MENKNPKTKKMGTNESPKGEGNNYWDLDDMGLIEELAEISHLSTQSLSETIYAIKNDHPNNFDEILDWLEEIEQTIHMIKYYNLIHRSDELKERLGGD